MPKVLIVDTYYPDFLRTWEFEPDFSEESQLRSLLNFSFGTADFYSRNLRTLGWDAVDYIANCSRFSKPDIEPDVVFMQDLSIEPPVRGKILAGQCSCPWPGDEQVRKYDVIFSSFPHYVDRFERMGIKAVYNPLAFEPVVRGRVDPWLQNPTVVGGLKRENDVVFVGGVGAPSHWRNGMETLEAVAREIPSFKWWGYGASTLDACNPLRDKYQGEAWGLDMYRIMLQSKIVLNRHGEVAQGYTNNMRTFEATGCGALLLTERSINLNKFFDSTEAVGYGSPEEAVYIIRRLLENPRELARVALNGQIRTLRDHTYAQRMKTVSDTLMNMLYPGTKGCPSGPRGEVGLPGEGPCRL